MIVPVVGRSIPATRFKSVDLPEPHGPMIADELPFGNVDIRVGQHGNANMVAE